VDLSRVTSGRTPWQAHLQRRPKAVFATYLESIATPAAWQAVPIVPGYAHLDVTSAEDNEAVPLIADFIRRVRRIPPGFR
jgi:hypothetical protein